MSRRGPLTTLLLAGLLLGGVSVAPGASAGTPEDPAAAARARLEADAAGHVWITTDGHGRIDHVGTGARTQMDNPGVGRRTSVAAAARAHLDRYGAALGARPGSTYVRRSIDAAVGGVDVVRYDQHVDGVPVLGGEVVLGLDADRELRSLDASVAADATVTDPTVPATAATRTALAVSRRAHRGAHLTVTDLGRWVLDPEVAGLDLPGGTRTVRRLEVADGASVHDLVLVDDHTGAVVLRTSLVDEIDRVVCDDGGVRSSDNLCANDGTLPGPPGRSEGSAPSTVADVNAAYDNAGLVSALYQQVGGLDLTGLIGLNTLSGRHLSATVRYCSSYVYPDDPDYTYVDPCPYPNAFWNGQAMFYGTGYAVAPDVVGHEMTHGVIDQYSRLFDWGQSGAINESIADVMGEIVDHRDGTDDDSGWLLGEDLPDGAVRSMADPGLFHAPDRMTSPDYDADADYLDNGGVHTNAGIGDKTAYLISQGGTFNGQTITGIDAGDPTLARTARLYLGVLQALPSGASYAVLGQTLEQTCANLARAGTAGFTTSHCDAVHRAVLATELASPPAYAAPAPDASTACPANTSKRVLADSEKAPRADLYTAGVDDIWTYTSTNMAPPNATSGIYSWFAADPEDARSSWMAQYTPISLPAGQHAYLSFRNWYLLDYDDAGNYYDGGIVSLGVGGAAPVPLTSGWVNGPDHTLYSGSGNDAAGKPAFSGDSHGWTTSRVDLTAYAGKQVRPRFEMHSDESIGYIGWYLDDIQVYTCDTMPGAPPRVTASGRVGGALLSWTTPTHAPSLVRGYRVTAVGGPSRTVGATVHSAVLSGLALARDYAFDVRAIGPNGALGPATRTYLVGSRVSMGVTRSGSRLTFTGTVYRNRNPYTPIGWGGCAVYVERWTGTRWARVTSSRTTTSKGRYVLTYRYSRRASYRVRFDGNTTMIGSVSVTRRR